MTCGQIEPARTALLRYTVLTWGAEFVLQKHMFCKSGFSRLRKCTAEDAPGKGAAAQPGVRYSNGKVQCEG
jgi:hypothetical protein